MLIISRGDVTKRGEAVELLQELFQIHKGKFDLPLMVYWSYEGWQV